MSNVSVKQSVAIIEKARRIKPSKEAGPPKKRGRKKALTLPETRVCSFCKTEYPLTIEFYYKLHTGFRYFCKECSTNLEPVKRFKKWSIYRNKEDLLLILQRLKITTRAKELILFNNMAPTEALRTAIEELKP